MHNKRKNSRQYYFTRNRLTEANIEEGGKGSRNILSATFQKKERKKNRSALIFGGEVHNV